MYHFLIPYFNLLLRLTNCVGYKDFNCASKTDPNLNIRFSLILPQAESPETCVLVVAVGHTFWDKVTLHSEPQVHICKTGMMPDPLVTLQYSETQMRGCLKTGRMIIVHLAWLTSIALSKVSSGMTPSRSPSDPSLPGV